MKTNIEFISAGAGSGKTYNLTERMEALLASGQVQPAGIIATTFTKMAASELQERVRQKLIESGKNSTANAMGQAQIGTVNSVCGQLVERFAFEAGLPPEQTVIDEIESHHLFNQALDETLEQDTQRIRQMNALSSRLQIQDKYTKKPLWRAEIKHVVDAARSNNISPEELRAFSKSSVESLLSYFPDVSKRDLTAELRQAISSAIDKFDSEFDSSKGSLKYFEQLKQCLSLLNSNRMTWGDWIKLSKDKPTKKSLELAEPIQAIASDYAKHPELRQDISEFTDNIFNIAADSLAVYRNIKTKRSLVDFVDQEQRLLEILDNPIAIEAIGEDLQLLMVDEFQDTSPIQLAIFAKLSELADIAIWVGDIKQSIYGFRGSDPELMLTVVEHLQKLGSQVSILETSWRSRPELVNYINNVFVPAFGNSLTVEQVKLSPARPAELSSAAIEHWQLEGSNKTKQASALAAAVQALVESGDEKVIDKQTKQIRPVSYGDIAILCRSNDNLPDIAEAFTLYGVPISYRRPGLLATPEASLAMACLRRLASNQDTFASAEIRSLSQGELPETWINDRLQYLQGDSLATAWGETEIDALQALANERERLLLLTPTEAFEQALLVTHVRETLVSWCKTPLEAELRLKNLDSLLSLSHQYLEYCLVQNIAATVPGLIIWLQNLSSSEEDWLSEPSGNAIMLLTHHRSKGLEWPVVFALDLYANVKPRNWGLNVDSDYSRFDWSSPLTGRTMRYWPSFFGAQSKDIVVKDLVEAGPEGQHALNASIEEGKRLLYVSLTRARDKLVLVTPQKGAATAPFGHWIDCVDNNALLPAGERLELSDGTSLTSKLKTLPVSEATFEVTQEDLHWPRAMAESLSFSETLPRFASPSTAPPIEGAIISGKITLSDRISLHGAPDMTNLGEAIHAIIATDIINENQNPSRNERILIDHGVAESINNDEIAQMTSHFMSSVRSKFQPLNVFVEYPIQFINEQGQDVKGWIDLLLETAEGWVIIDHKSSPKARSEWDDTALGYSGQLATYRHALEAASEKPVLSTWIHFAITGGLIEVELPVTSTEKAAA
jgi:ATP-dependent helicase/nuclease subunit A